MSVSLVFALACAAQEPAAAPETAPAPRRLRVFDRMPDARFEGRTPPPPMAPAEPVRSELGFEPGFAASQRAWLGRRIDRQRTDWETETWKLAALPAEGGVHGGALTIGPGIAPDGSYLVFVVDAQPLVHYVLRGRVKLEGHPNPDSSSARDCVMVREHWNRLEDPTKQDWRFQSDLETHRATRLMDSSGGAASAGWDRFELEIPLTHGATGSLEIRLIHRTGGSEAARTWFDDVELIETRLSEEETWKLYLRDYRPNDGNADATPWRLRVTLPTEDRVKEETRDALLLPPPETVAIPLTLPPADARPLLRFEYGMLHEAAASPGDGARITVSFAAESGASVELGKFDFDPKNAPDQRCWLSARVDLAKVAGQSGELRFASSDPGERDAFDAVVIATPRIEPADEAPRGFNVLVMASDTLRSDRLSAFGYARKTSPNLERLAEKAIRFPKTRAQAPWTLPSFSSIMTSMYPSEHGAGRGGRDEWTPLDPGVTTLADVLARVGYETAAITANHLVSPEYGLDQGFEHYAVPGEVQWQKQGMESVDLDAPRVVKFLEEHKNTPFFLFWHMMDPHLPYTTQSAFRREFAQPGYDGRFQGAQPMVPFQVLDPRPGRRWFTHEGPPKPPALTEADARFVSDYYDAEIREIDTAIGTVIDALQRTGLWERTIVAMISDHGEGLGEHGHYHHGYTLFEDQVRIPFILRVPGREEGRVFDAPAASLDLAPSILGALSIPAPETFRGANRMASLEAMGAAKAAGTDAQAAAQDPKVAFLTAEPIFLEYPSYDSSAEKAVILGDFKYLHDPWFHTEALYDTAKDPLERTDVRAQHPELVKHARALLDGFRWEQMQKGRFHVRVRGQPGARLRIEVATDDLFDANFATTPQVDERAFTLDFDRRRLILDMTMTSDRIELVCWCRGNSLTLDVTLDGEPLQNGIRIGAEDEGRPSPVTLARDQVPSIAGGTLEPPMSRQALLWMEPGAGNVAPVVPSPEEAEILRQLGYAH